MPLLDAWTNVSTVRSASSSFPVSAGSDRVLVAFEFSRGGASSTPLTAVTYGGQSMTLVDSESTTQGANHDSAFWILDEAGIAAASGDTFSFTPDITGISFRFVVASYEDIDQETPVLDSFNVEGLSGANPPAQSLTTVVDSVVLTCLQANQSTGSPNASYTNLTERIEENVPTGYLSVAEATATSTSFLPGTTLTHDQAGHLIGASLLPFASIIEGSASGAAVSGSTANAEATDRATGSATSDSAADAIVLQNAEASGAAVSGGSSDPSTLAEPSSAAGAAVSGSSAEAITLVVASASSAAVSGSTANASEFSGARATGAAVSGSTANAAEAITIIPPLAIEESFALVQSPVILVDVFLTSELNIWTRPIVGVFAEKEYQPLAGVTNGITIRNSLDGNALSASVQLSGQSQEIVNIALVENYRNRKADVILGNLNDDGEIEAIEILLTGVVVNMTVSDNDEESVVSMVIDSIFKDLDRSEARRQSASDLARTSQDDSFFDFKPIEQPAFGSS